MTAHDHRTYVDGCYRCELSRDEVQPMSDHTPNPGSEAARKQGCVCPVLDNARGLGAQGTRGPDAVFWINGDCPMHGVVMNDA